MLQVRKSLQARGIQGTECQRQTKDGSPVLWRGYNMGVKNRIWVNHSSYGLIRNDKASYH